MFRLIFLIASVVYTFLECCHCKQYIIKFKPHVIRNSGLSVRHRIHQKTHPSNVVRVIEELHFAAVTLPDETAQDLETHADVEYVEPDHIRYPLSSNDILSGSSQIVPWGVRRVQADQVSYINNRKICIVDSGYDITHPDLPKKNVNGTTLKPSLPWNEDPNHHGTHVAGTIAAIGNSIGVVGVIKDPAVHLHIARVFGATGGASSSLIIEGVLACVAAGSHVINLSLGGGPPSRTSEDAYAYALSKGTLPIASAGNDGQSNLNFPASYPQVVSVGATDIDNHRASFSQYNAKVELCAPGVDVVSTITNEGVGVFFGGQLYPGRSIREFNPVTRRVVGSGSQENVVGTMIDCGRGESPCQNATNAICFIQRPRQNSTIYTTAIYNCESQGGIGAILYNYVGGNRFSGITAMGVSQIPVILLGSDTGANLTRFVGTRVKITSSFRYSSFDGTSMAAPHATGVAALVWSHMPQCSATSLREILINSSLDLGTPGRDDHFGYGLVQAKAAVDYFRANGCASPRPTVSPTMSPRVSWNVSLNSSKTDRYSCSRACEVSKLWVLNRPCPGKLFATVSAKPTDFPPRDGNRYIAFNAGNESKVFDFLGACWNIGKCQSNSTYPRGNCVNRRLLSPRIPKDSTAFYFSLSLGTHVGIGNNCSAIANATVFLDAKVTMTCDNGGVGSTPTSAPTARPTPQNVNFTGNLSCGDTVNFESTNSTDRKYFSFVAPARDTTVIASTCVSKTSSDSLIALYRTTNGSLSGRYTYCAEFCGCPGSPRASLVRFTVGRDFGIFPGQNLAIAASLISGTNDSLSVQCIPKNNPYQIALNVNQASAVTQRYTCIESGCSQSGLFALNGVCSNTLLTVSPKISEFHNAPEVLAVSVNGLTIKNCSQMGYCMDTGMYDSGRCLNKYNIGSQSGTVDIRLQISSVVNQCPLNMTSNMYLDAEVKLECGTPPMSPILMCNKSQNGMISPWKEAIYKLDLGAKTGFRLSNFTLSTCNSTFDTVLTLFKKNLNTSEFKAVWSCDDCGPCGTRSQKTSNGSILMPMHDYYVSVRGLSTSSGNFQVKLDCAFSLVTTTKPPVTSTSSSLVTSSTLMNRTTMSSSTSTTTSQPSSVSMIFSLQSTKVTSNDIVSNAATRGKLEKSISDVATPLVKGSFTVKIIAVNGATVKRRLLATLDLEVKVTGSGANGATQAELNAMENKFVTNANLTTTLAQKFGQDLGDSNVQLVIKKKSVGSTTKSPPGSHACLCGVSAIVTVWWLGFMLVW